MAATRYFQVQVRGQWDGTTGNWRPASAPAEVTFADKSKTLDLFRRLSAAHGAVPQSVYPSEDDITLFRYVALDARICSDRPLLVAAGIEVAS
jgi:hypothetical protein